MPLVICKEHRNRRLRGASAALGLVISNLGGTAPSGCMAILGWPVWMGSLMELERLG